MAQPQVSKSVAVFRPRASVLEATINRLAGEIDSPGISDHAFDRMEERGITALDVLRVLRVGVVVGEILAGKNPGEWKCKVVSESTGGRDIGVVTVVIHNSKLFVKTVEWEDK